MAQREWVEKDFYKELGVSSDASPEEIKRAYRKLARGLHPDANPDNPAAGERFKAVSEAHNVLSDPAKRKEYDETRRLFAGGGFGGRRFDTAAVSAGGFGVGVTAPSSTSTICSTPPAAAAAPTSVTCSAACSGAAPAPVPAGRGAATTWRPRRSWISSRPPRAWRCRCG